jgi:hypothetical protein
MGTPGLGPRVDAEWQLCFAKHNTAVGHVQRDMRLLWPVSDRATRPTEGFREIGRRIGEQETCSRGFRQGGCGSRSEPQA